MITICQHGQFRTQARITRLTDGDGGPVTDYTADLAISCAQCGLPFRFLGPAGLSPHQPMVSADGLELRAPIAPDAPQTEAQA